MTFTMIQAAIRHYPPAIGNGINAVLRQPRAPDRRVFTHMEPLNENDKICRFTQENFKEERTFWRYAFLSPCTMAAAFEFSQEGQQIERAAMGHFGARVEAREIRKLLDDFSPERTRVLLAGMSQRSSPETLEKSCQKIAEMFAAKGFDRIGLTWNLDEQPVFFFHEGDGFWEISDLGLGIKIYPGLSRTIYVGLCAKAAVMLSIRKLRAEVLAVDILSVNQDKLQFCPDQVNQS